MSISTRHKYISKHKLEPNYKYSIQIKWLGKTQTVVGKFIGVVDFYRNSDDTVSEKLAKYVQPKYVKKLNGLAQEISDVLLQFEIIEGDDRDIAAKFMNEYNPYLSFLLPEYLWVPYFALESNYIQITYIHTQMHPTKKSSSPPPPRNLSVKRVAGVAACGKGQPKCARGTRCVKGTCVGSAAAATRKRAPTPPPPAMDIVAAAAVAAVCGNGKPRCVRGTRCIKGVCVAPPAAAPAAAHKNEMEKSPPKNIIQSLPQPPKHNNNMNLVETLAPLYGKTAHGQTKVWFARYYANADGSHARYEIEHGQDGGKLQLTVREITEGKNIGRKNETTPLEQCKNEIIKKWTDKQKKEGYTVAGAAAAAAAADASAPPEVEDADAALAADIPRPMLAQQYKRDKNSIVFPCFVQPKLDGLRCLIYRTPSGKIATQSRTGGFFEHLQHITESIAPFFENPAHHSVILDGELYTTEIPFETLAGLIKKKKVGAADLSKLRIVQYHIYDFIDRKNKKITFAERAHVLSGEFAPQYTSSSVVFVDTTEISNGAEMTAKFQEFVSAGYEGIMLRNRNGVYRENVRSVDLQKYKEFEEEEYTIVGYTQGEGRDAGTVIWICETEEGRRFNVRPRGTLAARRELFQNAGDFVGKKLTVIFQELSEQKVPRFPVGKDVRIGY